MVSAMTSFLRFKGYMHSTRSMALCHATHVCPPPISHDVRAVQSCALFPEIEETDSMELDIKSDRDNDVCAVHP
jgi:hypothetical protein